MRCHANAHGDAACLFVVFVFEGEGVIIEDDFGEVDDEGVGVIRE